MKKVKSYKKARKNYLKGIDYMRRKMKIHILLLVLMAAAVIVYSVFCTIDMKIKDIKSTKLYVRNYTEQIADMIDMEISSNKKIVGSFSEADKLIKDKAACQDFLNRKRKLYQFEFALFQNDQTGMEIISGYCPMESMELDSLEKSDIYSETLNKGLCGVGIKKDYLLFAKNIYQNGHQTGTLWIGYKDDKLKNIFVTKTLKKESSVSCIIDRNGYILLASDEGTEDLNVAVLLGNDENTKKNIVKMRDDILEGENGAFRFMTADNRTYFLSYDVTEMEEWAAVTVIPTDLFTGVSDSYVGKMLGSLFAALVVFGAVFALLFRSYIQNSRRIERFAFFDELTGGINKIEFQMKYQELCRKKKANEYTLVLMDCMDFKMINESLGAKNGDRMLQYFYHVISDFLNQEKGEFLARTEMDHFFLYLKEKDPEIISRRLDRIVHEINVFRNTDLSDCNVTFWMGACMVEDNETDLTILQDQVRAVIQNLERRDVGRLVFYDRKLAEKIQREREMERAFDEALLKGDFCVYYQPKVDFRTGAIVGAEALVRWEIPGRGVVSPGEFIPLLESNGKIRLLDMYVFDHVCRWQQEWIRRGGRSFPVSVNLSRSHFINESFLLDFVHISDKYQIDRRLIEFEITETIFLDAGQALKVREGLHMIHQYGFRCSLDDFGIGYSSLTFLSKFDIDALKLDRSFFVDLESEKARKVLTCVANMAESLGIRIVAEGIETNSQISYLEKINCSIVQGYFFSRPLPEKEFEKWVESFRITDHFCKNE